MMIEYVAHGQTARRAGEGIIEPGVEHRGRQWFAAPGDVDVYLAPPRFGADIEDHDPGIVADAAD
ncbi:hypothetical protein RZS08_40700, partial [Arthrospira platensis SPKY1]|nr:hypothetical protein [Arthrospira platensis SPKY1]